LVVVFHSTNPEKIVQLKQELESLGLLEGEHFTVTWPEEGKTGFTYLKREGIVELAYIAIYGTDEARKKEAASLIEHLRERAEAKGKDVLEKLEKLIKHGEERGFRHATGMKEVVEIEWEGHRTTVSVEVKEIHAEEDGDKLRISVTAVVSGVEGRWEMTFLRREKDRAVIGYTCRRPRRQRRRRQENSGADQGADRRGAEYNTQKRQDQGDKIHKTTPRWTREIRRINRRRKEMARQTIATCITISRYNYAAHIVFTFTTRHNT
jgi:hypothetical protein